MLRVRVGGVYRTGSGALVEITESNEAVLYRGSPIFGGRHLDGSRAADEWTANGDPIPFEEGHPVPRDRKLVEEVDAPEFMVPIDDRHRVAGRFIGGVRDEIVRAAIHSMRYESMSEEDRLRLRDVFEGRVELTLRDVAEWAWRLGYVPRFRMEGPKR